MDNQWWYALSNANHTTFLKSKARMHARRLDASKRAYWPAENIVYSNIINDTSSYRIVA